MQKKNSQNKYIVFLISYLFLWIILSEFILPVNDYLPKLSTMFIWFPSFLITYNAGLNVLATITAIYLSLTAAYFLTLLLREFLFKDSLLVNFIASLSWFGMVVPVICLGLVLIYWFPQSTYLEYIFAFIIAFLSLANQTSKLSGSVDTDYILSARSNGLNDNVINKYIIWNHIQPEIFKYIFDIHYFLWLALISFEIIKNDFGLGSILNKTLVNRDLSALFTGLVIAGLLFYLGRILIKFLKNKFSFRY